MNFRFIAVLFLYGLFEITNTAIGGVINPPQVWEVQVRMKGTITTTLEVRAINGLIAKELAQAQCGGPSNCQVLRVTSKH
jgi:hypothetical protein